MNVKQKRNKIIVGLISTTILVLLDQWSKIIVATQLKGQEDFVIFPGILQLHYLENTGAAFSMLENKLVLFYIITPVLVVIICYMYYRIPLQKRFYAMHFILVFLCAGAIGNFIDRILYHYVIDFIYFSLIDFPVFNVADIYVTCSVCALFFVILFYYKDHELDMMLPKFMQDKENKKQKE